MLLNLINFISFVFAAVSQDAEEKPVSQTIVFKKDEEGFHAIVSLAPRKTLKLFNVFKNGENANKATPVDFGTPEYLDEISDSYKTSYRLKISDEKNVIKKDGTVYSFAMYTENSENPIFSEGWAYDKKSKTFMFARDIEPIWYAKPMFYVPAIIVSAIIITGGIYMLLKRNKPNVEI